MELFTSLLSQLKNPWQYIAFGLTWILVLKLDINIKYLLPLLLISVGFSSLIPYMIKKVNKFYKNRFAYKKEVYRYIKILDEIEKKVFRELVKNNTLSIQQKKPDRIVLFEMQSYQHFCDTLYNMELKGLGKVTSNPGSIIFTANEYAWLKYKEIYC